MLIDVVGIGADAEDLNDAARRVLPSAQVVVGSPRQLAVVQELVGDAVQVPLPSPLRPGLRRVVQEHADKSLVILASGDPLFHGIGTVCVQEFGANQVRVTPAVSSVTLACARLGWASNAVHVVSLVTGSPAHVVAQLVPGRRVMVLSRDASSPGMVRELLRQQGFGESSMWVLSDLGSASERVEQVAVSADQATVSWTDLNVIAVDVAGGAAHSIAPGLPEDLFEHDGQITKRQMRAVTLAYLRPLAGETLWDLGAGAGSVGIEWLRLAPDAQVFAVERQPERAARCVANAEKLGVPGLHVVSEDSATAVGHLPEPNAIFVGGGLTSPGLVKTCWLRLRPGGRLVANAVTLESQALVADWHRELGGQLVQVGVSSARPVGDFWGWQPAMPVVLWCVEKKKGLL